MPAGGAAALSFMNDCKWSVLSEGGKYGLTAVCAFLGHASGVPGPWERARPCPPPLYPGSSVQEKEESGLGAQATWKPPTTKRLTALHTLSWQYELSEQHRQSFA